MSNLNEFDIEYRKDYKILCGVDEAGRGPLAGPVCCAAVILNPDDEIEGLNDSKKLTAKKREVLYNEIISRAICYDVEFISEKTIDEINILNATMLGMKIAIENLSVTPSLVLIDGNKCPDTDNVKCEYVIQGDAKSASIAAASILAKVTRDNYIIELGKKYPEYKLEQHKGYGTKLHYEMIAKYGVQDFHRLSFLKKLGY
ncbi:MAG: ribonuclease HII [Oscillospiraceae bacterium]